MGTKYPTQSISGYNSSPPPDDGSTGDDNKVTWAKHKTKLGDPVKTLAEAINTAIVDHVDVETVTKTGAYTTVADDNGRVIETTSSPTITLGAAATMGSGYRVTVKCVSGTTDVATSDTIDGSADTRCLQAGDSETYAVNEASSAYLIEAVRGVTAAETVTLTNKTLTSPTINGGTASAITLNDPDIDLGSDAEGDVYYRDSGGDLTRLAIGTAGQSLNVNSGATAPEWVDSGKWTLLSSETPTAQNNYDVTWDETAYSSIKIIAEGVSPATDNEELQIQFGHTDGGTILGGSGDYAYTSRQVGNNSAGTTESTSASFIEILPDSSTVGSSANEGLSLECTVTGGSSILSCPVASGIVTWVDPAGSFKAASFEGVCIDGSAETTQFDTVRLRWSGSANFDASGTIYVYGLKNS